MRAIKPANLKQTRFPRLAIALRLAGFLMLLPGHLLLAQSAQYMPIISGGVGFFDSKNTGVNFAQTVVDPVVVAPLGKRFLAETRFDLRGFYERQNGTSGPTRPRSLSRPGRACVCGQLRPLPQSTRAIFTPNYRNRTTSHAGARLAKSAGRTRPSKILCSLTL